VRLSDGAPSRTRNTSTVPRTYSPRGTSSRLPTTARRQALSDRLRSATTRSEIGGSSTRTTRSLADRYTPSANVDSRNLRTGATPRSASAGRDVTSPGRTRRDVLSKRTASAADSSARASNARKSSASRDADVAKRASAARQKQRALQAEADRKAVRAMNARYDAAKRQDPEGSKRATLAARAAAIGADAALRSTLAVTPVGPVRGIGGADRGAYGGRDGYGSKDGGGGRWDGYGYGNGYWNDGCGGWSGWYWNTCGPWWGSWCVGWGWGWGWGGGWCSSPWWGWPGYSPYYRYWWPSYAYCSPSVVYNYYYTDEPISPEVVAQPAVEVVAAPMGDAIPRTGDVAVRAATEYMALGDRAFTEGRYGDAVHYYAKAIEFAPEDGVLYLVLSDALFATGDYHYAAFALRRALELHPEVVSLGIDKRNFYGDPADFVRQLSLLEKYVADHPIDEDARLVLGANYLFSREAQRCVEFLDSPFSVELKASRDGQVILAAALEQLATAR